MANEMWSCADETQQTQPGFSIAFKESDPSGISFSYEDEARLAVSDSRNKSQTAIPKIILNLKPSQEKSFTSPPQVPHPMIQSAVPPASDGNYKQATQIATQPAMQPYPTAPVSFYENPQAAPAPLPQEALAGEIRLVKTTDADSSKNNGGQSDRGLVPMQEPEQLPQPPPMDNAGSQLNSATSAAPSQQSEQKLGEAPRDTSLEFLRQQAVLLKPCEWQMDIGLSYLIFDNHFADVTANDELVETRLRRRLLTMPMEVRYGLYQRVQLFANMPFGWANTEISRVGEDYFANNGGIGDLNFGGTFHIYQSNGKSCSPDVLATIGFTAPTGNGNALLGILETPDITLGQGFWAGFWNVLVIHKYDPVVVFYGFGSRHYFSRDIQNIPGAKPGDQYIYQLGTGFAINERITLSTTFFGSYITEARVNDHILRGTILEPMYLRFAATITRCNNRIVEPFVEIGLTDDSANARAGITWTF